MMSRLTLAMVISIFLVAALPGCKKEQAGTDKPGHEVNANQTAPIPLPPAVPLDAPLFLSKPLETKQIETTNEALPLWRKYAKNRPLLAILAQSPALAPIPEEKRDDTQRLLREGDDTTLARQTGMSDPDPTFLPTMSASAALDADWLAGVVWVFPTTSSPDKIDPAIFRQQLAESGIATADEAETLTFEFGVFRGTLRGKTFIAAPLSALPDITQPLLLHIDCDYFKPLYKGEIKTPLYPLLVETLNAIKTKQWHVATATVSRSTFGAELPLKTRFLSGQIVEILSEPEMLDRPIPSSWSERANALYLENFMQKDKMREIYQALEKEDPADPSIKYALYDLARQFNQGDDALEYLRQAVQIDPVYALEYVTLSDLAMQRKRPEQAVKMLKLARVSRPDEPLLLMLLARTMLNAGDRSEAATITSELRALNWSELYYPGQREATQGLIQLLETKPADAG